MKFRLIKLAALLLLLVIPRIGASNAYFNDSTEITGISLATGCWAEPSKPILNYPSDDYVANVGSDWLNDPHMDWEDSRVCPDRTVSYQYESYHDSDLNDLAYRSDPLLTDSKITLSSVSDGTYYWRVRAYDGEKWSDWSDVWVLTIDRTDSGSDESSPAAFQTLDVVSPEAAVGLEEPVQEGSEDVIVTDGIQEPVEEVTSPEPSVIETPAEEPEAEVIPVTEVSDDPDPVVNSEPEQPLQQETPPEEPVDE
jgi:hypothetical protein